MPSYATLAEALALAPAQRPEGSYTFQALDGVETRYLLPELEANTAARAAAIQALGLRKGDRVGLIVIEPEDFVLTFLACLRVGVLPAPLYPPTSFANLDAYAERTARVLNNAGATVLLASAVLEPLLSAVLGSVPSLNKLVPVEQLRHAQGTPDYPEISPDDLAFLQYTSGSTADPKGVMVTHAGLVSNARVICEAIGLHAGDPVVSWLPLYHDMGLIGFVLAPILQGLDPVLIPTLRFIKRPSVWFDTIHAHRGVASFAPNFAYALAARRVRDSQLAKWDLSCLRVLGCGAEPIQPATMRGFTERFAACGLGPEVIKAAYGMAEHTLAIALTPEGQVMGTRRVDAAHFEAEAQARPPADDVVAVEHVSCGRPFPGHEIRVVGRGGELLVDGHEGEICLRGPSCCPGYFQNPEASAAAWRDGWLHTGDLGYLLQGEVYVTGRIKDLLILNGRNIHPQSVEWCVAKVAGVRRGNVVAFSVPGATTERLVVCAESRKQGDGELGRAVLRQVQADLGLSAEVRMLEAGTLPKTSSGKLQRRKARGAYLAGAYSAAPSA